MWQEPCRQWSHHEKSAETNMADTQHSEKLARLHQRAQAGMWRERNVSLKFDHVLRGFVLLKNPPDLRAWITVLIFRLSVSIILLVIR